MKPVYSGHLGTGPDYQGVVSLHVNEYFRTITKFPDYGGDLINRFHCIRVFQAC